MVDFHELNIRNKEKAAAAAAAAAAQTHQKPANRLQITTNSLPNGTTSRTGTLYESRSSVSSPYGSGSSLNRTSSIRRASIRDREKVKKLNENFLDVLQAKDKIQEDVDEGTTSNVITPSITTSATKLTNKEERTSSITTATDSTVRESITIPSKKSTAPVVESILPPLKVPPPLPPPPTQTAADTLSDVKRRREERRRGIGVSTSNVPPTVTSPPLPISLIDTNHKNNNTKMSNGIHGLSTEDPLQRYTSPKQIEIRPYHIIDADHEKRKCCTIS
jgi:hypothetical protein